jgi:release factor glutamine methyltransferase
MPTVLELINLSTGYLKNKGIESPRINAEILLAKVLNCKRLELYLSFDRPLAENEINIYREFIKRRGKNEPAQYIIGSVEFYGLEFKIDSSALIPRPETEILVETIIIAYKDFINLNILDIGTGSGIIAISLAKYLNDAKIYAVDSSETALALAKENAVINGVDDKISFVKYDIAIDENISAEKFDLVVSNPPYISNEEYSKLQPELRVYEPRVALTDESDGFKFFNIIARKIKSLLKENGKIFFEVGQGQASKVVDILRQEQFSNIKTKKDYLNIERVVSGELN